MAWSSGVLEIMADARLISDGLGGADADFTGVGTGFGSELDGIDLPLFSSTDCLWFGTGVGFGLWKTSSANLSETRCERSLVCDGCAGAADGVSSKSNFVPDSWRMEN